MIGLDQTCSVYSRGSSGEHDQQEKSGLSCRLCHVATNSPSASRTELQQLRKLLWEPDYFMPPYVEIEVDGTRWVAIEGTYAALRGINGQPMYRRCDVVRAS